MADAAEVAIESALINRLLALSFSPVIPVSLPNVTLTPAPIAGPGVKWLRATFLPADSFAIGIADNAHNQHYGILQVDVFVGLGIGDYAPRRIAAQIAGWFKRGTQVTKDGFIATVYDVPRIARAVEDDPWWMIPVSIPYRCFARPTV